MALFPLSLVFLVFLHSSIAHDAAVLHRSIHFDDLRSLVEKNYKVPAEYLRLLAEDVQIKLNKGLCADPSGGQRLTPLTVNAELELQVLVDNDPNRLFDLFYAPWSASQWYFSKPSEDAEIVMEPRVDNITLFCQLFLNGCPSAENCPRFCSEHLVFNDSVRNVELCYFRDVEPLMMAMMNVAPSQTLLHLSSFWHFSPHGDSAIYPRNTAMKELYSGSNEWASAYGWKADAKWNPRRETIWTDLYHSGLHESPIATGVRPVYVQDYHFGQFRVDVSTPSDLLDTLIAQVSNDIDGSFALLLSGPEGIIVSGDDLGWHMLFSGPPRADSKEMPTILQTKRVQLSELVHRFHSVASANIPEMQQLVGEVDMDILMDGPNAITKPYHVMGAVVRGTKFYMLTFYPIKDVDTNFQLGIYAGWILLTWYFMLKSFSFLKMCCTRHSKTIDNEQHGVVDASSNILNSPV